MKLKLQLLILFLMIFFKTGYTQNFEKDKDETDLSSHSFLERTEFKAGYSGNIYWNNGLNFGTEYVWKAYTKTKDKKRGERTNTHQFLLNGNLGFSTNFFTTTDTGIFTNYGLTWRRTNKKGKQFSIEFNPLGYYRSFLPETYKVVGDNVTKSFLPSRGYYAPSISVGIGKLRENKTLSGRYLNVNLMLRTPYNAGIAPFLSFQYGYRFNFKKKK